MGRDRLRARRRRRLARPGLGDRAPGQGGARHGRAGGVTIVISTAYLDEAERCHRLALLHEGHLLQCDTPQALKAKIPGAVLLVPTKEPRRVRAVIAPLPGVLSTLLAGGGVRVTVDNANLRLPEIGKALAASSLSFDPPQKSPPTIEDLFVTLEQPL